MLAASYDKTAKIWDIGTLFAICYFLSSDGASVLAASSDKTAEIWDIANWDLGRYFFSADGASVLAAHGLL